MKLGESHVNALLWFKKLKKRTISLISKSTSFNQQVHIEHLCFAGTISGDDKTVMNKADKISDFLELQYRGIVLAPKKTHSNK